MSFDPSGPNAFLRDALQSVVADKYEITRQLEGGGMSAVFLARERALNQAVVIKVLPMELATAAAIERFKREIALTAPLQHPLIVPVVSAGDVDGLPYFVMPYVDGESLRRRLTRGPLSVRETVSVLVDVARALAFAHHAGVVHRDIKPANILLASESAVVADFGIAKARAGARNRRESAPESREESDLTLEGVSLGTPAYMAPEQVAGDSTIDHRADLYALGVVGYEMLVGAPPFTGRTPRRVLTAQLTDAPQPISQRRADIPPGLARILMQCLEKDLDHRPRSALDVVRALQDSAVMSTGERPVPTRARTRAILDDVRVAARSLCRTPAITLSAIVCLAIGLGVTTAVYSALDRALLQPPPFTRPSELVTVYRTASGGVGPFSPPNYVDLARSSRQLAALAAMTPGTSLLSVGSEAITVSTVRASGNLFPMLGLRPLRGRLLAVSDDSSRQIPIAVLSEELWRDRFGSDPSLIGRPILLDGQQRIVVGIAPRDFGVPHGDLVFRADVWIPLRLSSAEMQTRYSNYLSLVGRLAAGSTPARAGAELRRLYDGLVATFPDLRGGDAGVVPLQADAVARARVPLLLLFGAVIMVLGIAVSNVASLLLARSVRRRMEIAIRAALGASRWGVMQPVLAESLLLSGAGVALGLGVAWLSVRAISAYAALRLPQLAGLSVGARVLPLGIGLAVAAAVCAGAVPAWRGTRVDPQDALRGGRGGGEGQGHGRMLAGLVVAEVALSLILLIGAGLSFKAFTQLLQNDPGFDPAPILTLRTTISPQHYPGRSAVLRFLEPALSAIKNVPGVEAAGAINALPYRTWGWNFTILYEGQTTDPALRPVVEHRLVTPGFFAVTGQRLLSGRLPRDSDGVVVNAALVQRDFHGDDPVGKRFYWGDTTANIVGEVSDIRNHGPVGRAQPEAYFSYRTVDKVSHFEIMVRVSRGDPLAVAKAVRAAIRSVDPGAAVSMEMPMSDVIAESVALPRFVFWLIGIFAGVALVLAVAGLYGVMSYAVAQRTREIGIRTALGSAPARTVRLVARQGLTLVGLGLVCGLLGAVGLTRFMQSILYGVSPLDVPTWGLATVALAFTGALAALVPSVRAARIDPVRAIRSE